MDSQLFAGADVHPRPPQRVCDGRSGNGQHSFVVWLTGLSGAGKSTLAASLADKLAGGGAHVYRLDGDALRTGLNADLGFSVADRRENVRRTAEVAKLMVDAGVIVIASLISPVAADRETARSRFADGEFYEVFVDCPLAVCELRDPKGLYRRARAGEIPDFTGVHQVYEIPARADVVVHTDQDSETACVARILDQLPWPREQAAARGGRA